MIIPALLATGLLAMFAGFCVQWIEMEQGCSCPSARR